MFHFPPASSRRAWVRIVLLTVSAALLTVRPVPAAAPGPDPIFEWNAIMGAAVLAGGTGPLPASRVTAMVQAAVFDAVNGIERRYEPIHVAARGRGSDRAAAIQAAYAMLLRFYPLQASTLTPLRNASLAALTSGQGAERQRDITRGVEWGQEVADEIWNWRQTDGFNPNPPPPFRGADVPGVWRRTPPGNLDGAGPNFATMTPWSLTRPSQFRPPAPPALNSPEYTADFNEVRDWGRADGSLRSADQDVHTVFWTGITPLTWNRVAVQLATGQHLSALQKARLLARVNLAMADAAIACWDAKYRYVYWRPITAIPAGETDGNDDTTGDPTFTSWITTPNHPEYVSGHSSLSGAATFVLASIFGEDTAFSVSSEILYQGAAIPDRPFASFSDAIAEVADARVFGGIHFRTACVRGVALGRQVGEWVLTHAVRARHDD